MFSLKVTNIISIIFVLLVLILPTTACSRNLDEKGSIQIEERKKSLLDKLDNKVKLTALEINRLVVILSLKDEYNKGIEILEELSKSDVYIKENYIIYFGLTTFYIVKANKEKRIKAQVLKKAEEYLNRGFEYSPEKPIAHYKRAKGYEVMGCIEKAKKDLNEASNLASSKDLIFWEEGIYFSSKKFKSFLRKDLGRIERLEDNCLLEN